jgi:hypothetical protein
MISVLLVELGIVRNQLVGIVVELRPDLTSIWRTSSTTSSASVRSPLIFASRTPTIRPTLEEVRITTHSGNRSSHTADVLRRRRGCLYPALAQKLFMTFAEVSEVLLGIVVKLGVDGETKFVQLIENLVYRAKRLAHLLLLSRSCGVTSSGTCKPKAELIRRM